MPAESIELLIEFTKDEDARTRATAVAGLAKVADSRGFAPVLVALFDPADEVRIAAASALGIFADDRAFEALVEGLADPCEQVAVNCIWSLGRLPLTRSLHKVLDVLEDADAVRALRIAASAAVGERAEIAGSDLATEDALIEQARAVLLRALGDSCGDVRASALWSLGHLPQDPETVAACIAALEDTHIWAVRYAIEALAHFDDERAVEALHRISTGEDDTLRKLAGEILGRRSQ